VAGRPDVASRTSENYLLLASQGDAVFVTIS